MASRISYDDALHIAQKGKYYPQPTNHAGLPVNPVFCDYCGRGGLGGTWKVQDTPQWDLCMKCYVNLQASSNTTTLNGGVFPMSGNINHAFHNHFNYNGNMSNNTTNYNYPLSSTSPNTLQTQNHHQPNWQQQQNQAINYNYQSAWDSDVPGSYSNRIITSNDTWHAC